MIAPDAVERGACAYAELIWEKPLRALPGDEQRLSRAIARTVLEAAARAPAGVVDLAATRLARRPSTG